MASEAKLAELRAKALEAGVLEGTLQADVHNIFGFATNSGKSWTDRITDDQCDKLILLYTRHLIEEAK